MIVPVATAGGWVLGLVSLGIALAIWLRFELLWRRAKRELLDAVGPLKTFITKVQAALVLQDADGKPLPTLQVASLVLEQAMANAALRVLDQPEAMSKLKAGLPLLGEGLARGYVQAQSEPVVEQRMTNSRGGGGLPIRGAGKVVSKLVNKEPGVADMLIEQFAPQIIQKFMAGAGGGNGGNAPAAGGARSAPSGGGFPWSG